MRQQLGYQEPLAVSELFEFLAARAIPGVEAVDVDGYHRAFRSRADGDIGLLRLSPAAGGSIELSLPDVIPAELAVAASASRRLLDLDADPVAIDRALATSATMRPFVEQTPGRRLPGAFDPWATTVLAILGQRISVASARASIGRLADAHGQRVDVGHPELRRLFPPPEVIAEADLFAVRLPVRLQQTLRTLATHVAEGRIDLEGAPEEALPALLAIKGIGPWTAGYLGLRVFRDPDAFPFGDVAVAAGFRRLGLPDDPLAIARAAKAWRPWRGYALMHLWAS